MKTTTKSLIAAVTLLGTMTVANAFADETTVIKSTPDKYTETREGHGTKYTYQTDGVKSQEAVQGHGVQAKTTSNGTTTKQVYQDKHCQQKSVDNAATGETKVVSEGNCTP